MIKYTRYKKEHICIDCAVPFIAKAPAAKRCEDCRQKHIPGDLADRTTESIQREIEGIKEKINRWKNEVAALEFEILRRKEKNL